MKHHTVIVFDWSKTNKNSSSKNFDSTVRVEGKLKMMVLAERFEIIFLVGLLTNFSTGDVTRQAKTG
jgi:hypothetical protein